MSLRAWMSHRGIHALTRSAPRPPPGASLDA
jgi:hypothetical protein